ncbi:MAG TPA: transposase, partial [Steroidobacteraceae bacterium]
AKRDQAGRPKLRWRISKGPRRSLGWVPFKPAQLKLKGRCVRFSGKAFRVFEQERLSGARWKCGCFAQDAVGDWWLCVPVEYSVSQDPAPKGSVGIDLGLKSTAATSDGAKLEAGHFYRGIEQKIAQAQRRRHKDQARRLHRTAARRRQDALHKFSSQIVKEYQSIIIGDVSSLKLARTRMAKSVLDAGWGMLKMQLQYKGQQAGRCVQIVNERNTTRGCSSCRALTGPAGLDMLVVRTWMCIECGVTHDRDVNAARNILSAGRSPPSISGNKPSLSPAPPSQTSHRCEARISAEKAVA